MIIMSAAAAVALPYDFPPPYEDVEPPEYHDECSIEPVSTVNNRNRSDSCASNNSSIHTSNDEINCILIDNDGNSVYSIGDLLAGEVVVTPKEDINVDCILVDFVLVESCIMTPGKSLPRTIKKISITRHNVPMEQLPNGVLNSGYKYTFPFSLLIPYALPLATCNREHHPDLHSMFPSSMGAPFNLPVDKRQKGDLSDLSVRLTYGIRVRLAKDGSKLKDYFKAVPFTPVYPVDEYLGHYVGNYSTTKHNVNCNNSRNKLSSLRSGPAGDLTLTTPKPIIFGINENRNIKDLFLNLRFDAKSQRGSGVKKFLPDVRKLSYRVESSITIAPPKIEPNTLRPRIEVLTSHSFDMESVDWKNKGASCYSAGIHVPIVMPEKIPKNFTPTFATCLVSREYQVVIELQMGSSSAKPTKNNIEITVPIIVVADNSSLSRRESMESISCMDDLYSSSNSSLEDTSNEYNKIH